MDIAMSQESKCEPWAGEPAICQEIYETNKTFVWAGKYTFYFYISCINSVQTSAAVPQPLLASLMTNNSAAV